MKTNGKHIPEAASIEEPIIETPPVDFENEFRYFSSAEVRSVKIAGSFTGWKPMHEMKRNGNDWTLKLTIPFIDGVSRFEYKFVVNDTNWQINVNMPQVRDSNGNVNNYLDVPRRGGVK